MNELLRIYTDLDGGTMDPIEEILSGKRPRLAWRFDLVPQYAFAIPDDRALELIAGVPQPIVELGAGTGYWAALLKERGVDITPMDRNPPRKGRGRYGFKKEFCPVRRGVPATIAVGKVAWAALMLCWPCYNSSFAFDAVKAFRGDWLIYIGESGGGCTGDDAFHYLLDEEWVEVEDYGIPQWWGIHDRLLIFKRASAEVCP